MSSLTYARDHVVRDLTSRVLDRLASQEPKQVATAVEALGLSGEARLSVHAGLLLEGVANEALGINEEALRLVAEHLDREVKTNPSVAAISTKDLVLIHVDAAMAQQGGKALETKLEKQLKAVEFTGAIATVVLDQVDHWPEAVRTKVIGVLLKHQHPRLFTTLGTDSKEALPEALVGKFLSLDVGEEVVPCRKRVFGR